MFQINFLTLTPGQQCDVTKVQLCLLRLQASQVVTRKAFSGWESWRAACRRKPTVKMISFQPLHLVNRCGLCQDDRMEEICECKRRPQTLALFSPRNQIVLLFCFLRPACNVASKCPLLQVCEQVACADGLPDLAADCCVRLSVK